MSGPKRHSMAKRREVAALLSLGLSIRGVARRCSVAVGTVHAWLDQPSFRKLLSEYQQRDGAYVVRVLRAMRRDAIGTLQRIVGGTWESRTTPAKTAAQAAMWLLQHDLDQAYAEVGATEQEIRVIIEHEAADDEDDSDDGWADTPSGRRGR